MSTHRGKDLVELSPRRVWSRTEGWQTVRAWEGTREAVQGLIAQLQSTNGADRIDIFPDGPVARLEAYISSEDAGANETSTDTWELLGNDIQKNLTEHIKLQVYSETILASITAGAREVQSAEASKVESTRNTVITQIQALCTAEGKDSADAVAFLKALLKGHDAFGVSQYVLRKSSLVSSRYSTKIAFTGIQRLWTAAQLESTESVPANLLFTISSIEPPETVQAGYLWSWLKRTPTVAAVGRHKLQITQEWWLEAWSTTLYAQHA
ncbi:MAG: hypothetical protein AB1813_22200 [Verrucomicrobiota bacterium]